MGFRLKAFAAACAALWCATAAAETLPVSGVYPAGSDDAASLGTIAIEGSQIILGPPLMFTKQNIDQFDF